MDSCTNLQCCSVPLNFHQERRRKTDHERSNFPLHHVRRFSTSSVVFVCVVSLLFLCCYPVSVSCISLQFSNISEHALGSPFFIFGKTNFAITGEVVRAFPEDGCAPLSAVSASDGSDYFANKIVWMEPLHCSIESKIFNCQAVQCLAIISSSISRVPGNEMWTQWDINVTPELSPGENKVLQEKDLESLIHIPFVHVGREDADVIRKLLLAKDGALRDHDHIALINMSLMAERSGLAAESAKGELGLMVATLYDYSPESINQWDDVFTSFNFLFLFQVLLTFIHGFSFALASNKWLAYYRKSNGQTDNSSLTREAKVKQREKNRRRWMRQQQQRRFPGPPYQPREIRMPQEIAEPNSGIREQSVAKNEKDNDDPEQMITEHHEQHEQTIEMSLMQPPGNRNSNDFVQVPTHEDTVTMDMNAMEENQANFSQPASPAKHQHTEIEMADYRYSMARVKDSNASSWSECVPPHTRSAPASACHVHGRVKIDALADAQAEVVAIHYTHDSDEKFPAIVADKRSDAVTFDDIESRSRRSTVNTRKALIRPVRYNPQHAASDRDDTLTNNPDAGHDNGAAPAGAGTADSASANDNANGSPALGTSFSYIPLVILSLEMFAMFERALYCCLDPLGARHFIPYSIRRFLLTLSIPFTFSANLLLIFFWYETLARYGELTMHMMKSKYKKTKSTLQQWSANPIPASEQAMLAEEDEEDRDDRRDTFNLNLFPSSPSSLQFLTHFRLPFFCTCVTLFLCDFTFALLDVLYVSDLIFLPIVEIVYSICSIVFLASVVYVAIYLFHHFHFAAEKEKSYLKLLCVTSEKEQQEIFEANRKAAFEQIFTSSPTAGDANKEAAKENLFRELTLLNMQQMRSFAITVETAIRNQMRKIDANKNKKMHRLKSFVAFVGMGMIAFMIGNALSPFLLPWMDSPVMTVARQWIIYVAMWMLGTAHILCF